LNGIGFETARVIARHVNLVIITGYNDERSTTASVGGLHQYLSVEFRLQFSEDAIKADVLNANIRRLSLNLSSLASVRKAAAEVNTYPEPIHVH
jgi:NAD(P)-dependent dehydrogenase (short-subunit alcohol dehydrogenase family)